MAVDVKMPVSLNMRIMRKYDDLTPGEKKVADVVMLIGENIMDYNIASLAAESKVSEPTVVRFCRNIGIKGIKELKKAAMQSLYVETSPSTSINKELSNSDEKLVPYVIDNLITILNETKKLVNEDSLKDAIELLNNATYIKIVGYGGSSIVARHIHHYLRMAGMHVDLFRNYEDFYPSLHEKYNEHDVIIAISYSGNSNIALDLVRDAKNKGAHVISITSWGECKLNSLADVTLNSYYNGNGIIPGIHVYERISQMAIADMLIAGLYNSK